MNTTGIFSTIALAFGLAAFSVAIIRGDKTAKVIGSGTNGIANIIKAATHPGK